MPLKIRHISSSKVWACTCVYACVSIPVCTCIYKLLFDFRFWTQNYGMFLSIFFLPFNQDGLHSSNVPSAKGTTEMSFLPLRLSQFQGRAVWLITHHSCVARVLSGGCTRCHGRGRGNPHLFLARHPGRLLTGSGFWTECWSLRCS